MPRYYCDYCDTYLTHDSQAGRKQHNRGWKHRENVKLYYEQFLAGQGVVMNPGEWLRGPAPAGSLPRDPADPERDAGIPAPRASARHDASSRHAAAHDPRTAAWASSDGCYGNGRGVSGSCRFRPQRKSRAAG
ncbi:u1 small nuclear ribonucleoprotein c [Phytophthora cinnamomi]|uniref:u1 small nuclear ribonucleoprotein c n=1 Tax=Phytophthora cinnamomi TaxID=4785 RepID=UPI00355A205D|nr:u1 small nuclear ribonucleoprotein c [Phytophthora cinnamomi]